MTTDGPWTDRRKPSPGDRVLREDGRVCIAKGYKKLMAVHPTSKTGGIRMGGLGTHELPPTQAGMVADYPPVMMICGDEVPPRIISMNVFWPSVVDGPATCVRCLGAK